MSTPSNRIDDLLKARSELMAEIEAARRRSQVNLAVLFTDIVGSTEYFEKYGDVAGLDMVSRHARQATGIVEECKGRTVKTIGDSVMAELPAALDAVRAAVEIQRRLFRLNATLPEQERLQVRIGAHFGSCYRQGQDLYGDAVNGAAKITKRTGPAQILISRALFDALPSETQFRVNRLGEVALETGSGTSSGAAKEDVFEVLWTETEAYEALRHHTTMALRRGELMMPGQNASELLQAQPPAPRATTLDGATPAQPTPAATSQITVRYELLGELGKGGMGLVYKARDRETGDIVALKVLRPELAFDDQVMGRFKSEVRVARRITHKNVCRLHDLHRAGDTYYITMEIVEGQSLRSMLQRGGAMPPKKGIGIALQICAGLREAHAQGVVHRDMKPENVMVDETGTVKLMDFGIARSSLGMHQTAAGMVIGTPAYMAPEQVRGEPVDQRADIYALGHILYEIFTGSPTFKATTAMEVVFKQIQEQPRSPREIAPTLPINIEAAIIRCLEKDPAKRFTTVEELEAALQMTPEQYAALATSYPTPPPADPNATTVRSMHTPSPTMPTTPAMAPAAVASQVTMVQTPLPRAGTPVPAATTAAVPGPTPAAAPPLVKKSSNVGVIAAVAVIGFFLVAGGAWWMTRSKTEQVSALPPASEPAQNPPAQTTPRGSAAPSPPAGGAGQPNTPPATPGALPGSSGGSSAAPPPSSAAPPEKSPPPTSPAANPPEANPTPAPAAPPVRPLPSYELVRPLAGHTGGVTSVAFSADGRLLASGSADRTVRIWEVGSASMLKVLKGHTGNVTSVAFSGDNQLIASASLDKTVKLWNAGGAEVATLPKESVPVLVVAFAPNSRLLAAANQNGEVKLWDSGGPRGIAAFEAHQGPVHALAFSPDGRMLASGGRDGKVRTWQMTSGQPIRTLSGGEEAVLAVAFSPDGRVLASAGEDNTVRLWDAGSGRLLQTLKGHQDGVDALIFSTDGRVIASGSADKTIKLWDAATGKELKTLSGHVFGITGLAITRDGRWVASSASDNSIRLWRRE